MWSSHVALLALAGSYLADAFSSVDLATPPPSAPTAVPYKDFWCVSGLSSRPPNKPGNMSASACLEECKAAYPGAKYGEVGKGEGCWCHDSCECTSDSTGYVGVGPDGDFISPPPPNCCEVHREHAVATCDADHDTDHYLEAYGCKAETTEAFEWLTYTPAEELDCIGTYKVSTWTCNDTMIYVGDGEQNVTIPEGVVARSDKLFKNGFLVEVEVGSLLYSKIQCNKVQRGTIQSYFTSKEDCEKGINVVEVNVAFPSPYTEKDWLCGAEYKYGSAERRSLQASKPEKLASHKHEH